MKKQTISGKKLTPKQVENMIAVYAETGSFAATARRCAVSPATVSNYVKGTTKAAREVPIDVLNVRDERRKDFVNKAWENIGKANDLIGRRLDWLADRSDMSPESLADVDMRELTTAMGTLYDKAALVDGDPTERREITADDHALLEGVERIYEKIIGK